MTFIFFLKDDSIHEVESDTADNAFRLLCEKLGKSWAWLRTEVAECLSPISK